MTTRPLALLGFAVVAIVCFSFAGKYHNKHASVPAKLKTFDDIRLSIGDHLIKSVNGTNIRQNLRAITPEPHVAGTAANARVADTISRIWKANGLENVHFVEYDVLLSYPDYKAPNHVSVIDGAGKTVFKSNGTSPVILPSEQSAPGAGVQWVAYAGAGTVQGEPVYAHYGRQQDFERLEKLGISVKGRVVIIRYGFCFRGDKVAFAQKAGAIAVVLFSDPAEVAKNGTDFSHTYPSSEWLPSGGVQRGSVMHGNGDPLTPLVPSKADVYPTRTIEEAYNQHVLPRIPVLPISYGDAYEVLSRLNGRPVPSDWQGGLNFTYRLGPGFKDAETTIKVDVRSTLTKRKIRNVVGYIKGAVEPDQYVILGNHYDAWVYGALDPNSGTSTLAEVGRALVQTMKDTQWRPARTIMFCNWDAEEHGIIGSTEFLEEFEKQLTDRAVVYLNVDTIHSNMSFAASTIPSLFQIVVDTAKRIPNPMISEVERARKTVYDTWVRAFPGTKTPTYPDFPDMPVPGGGSDHAGFLNFLGIPVVDFRYRNTSWSEYPLYHSLYETPFISEHIFDTNDFAVHKAVGQFWAELARTFADQPIIPLNVSILAEQLLNNYVHDLKGAIDPLKHRYPEAEDARLQLSHLIKHCQHFVHRARQVESEIAALKQPNHDFVTNPDQRISQLSRRLMKVERCFINPNARPDAPSKRHLLYSISDKDSYASSVMSSVYDSISDLVNAKTTRDKVAAGRSLASAISLVQLGVQCAVKTFDAAI
uniref:Glutamate carboxypeptidase 2 n=1 Tax=Panagrellus redivivus TaxID=6233 RepID=A0A7E4WCP9_PANRE